MIEENTKLQAEIDRLRQSQNSIRDAQTVIDEIVNRYFEMGHDRDLKDKRIFKAD